MVTAHALDRGVCDHMPLLLWLSKYHRHIWAYLVNIIHYMVLLSKDHHPLVVPLLGSTVSSLTLPPLAIQLLAMAKPRNRLQTKRHSSAPSKRKTLVQCTLLQKQFVAMAPFLINGCQVSCPYKWFCRDSWCYQPHYKWPDLKGVALYPAAQIDAKY